MHYGRDFVCHLLILPIPTSLLEYPNTYKFTKNEGIKHFINSLAATEYPFQLDSISMSPRKHGADFIKIFIQSFPDQKLCSTCSSFRVIYRPNNEEISANAYIFTPKVLFRGS